MIHPQNVSIGERNGGKKVTLPDGATLAARVLAADPDHNIAALSVGANNLPTIALGDSGSFSRGSGCWP
jgi:S1-C subfamily serine protease